MVDAIHYMHLLKICFWQIKKAQVVSINGINDLRQDLENSEVFKIMLNRMAPYT